MVVARRSKNPCQHAARSGINFHYLARVNANTTEEPPLFSYKRTTLLFCAKFSIPSLPNKQINGGRWIFGNN
uniref:Uncharacterized protein n=1 Tax=Glossina palpalis gambiensis TaxID=67801 RepID=A0A1B0C6C7_9MUSC